MWKKKSQLLAIIINWNDYDNTYECLESIFKNNKNESFNIVLIDNNSHDGSREKLIKEFNLEKITPTNRNCEKQDIFKKDKSFEKYEWWDVCLNLNDNYGFTWANNFGMKFAWQNNFEYIMRLNNDTIVNKWLLGNMKKWLKLNPNSIISPKIVFYPDINYIRFLWWSFNWFGKPKSEYFKKNHHKIQLPNYIESVLCSGCLMFYTRETLRKLGWQDNKYFFNLDDADYSYEAYKKWIKTIVDTNTLLYHKSARSVASKPWLAMYYYIRNIVYFRRKHFVWYKNIVLYIYLLIHILWVLIIFTLRWKKPYKFIKYILHDIAKWNMWKFTWKIMW